MRFLYTRLNKQAVSVIQLLTFISIVFLSFSASNVNAMPSYNRLAGLTRYDTAVAIAEKGWQQSDYAILAYGENFPDALASAPLAKKYNAPILLTNANVLAPQTKRALLDLKVKHVLIVGGTAVVSTAIEKELKVMGLSVIRLAGKDRYETSIEIAKQLGNVSGLFVTTGEDYADALSAGSVAGKLNMPILLVPKDTLPSKVTAYLATQTIKTSYVVGNWEMISNSVMNQFPNAQRISGMDGYARNIAILNQFAGNYAAGEICLATGGNFADALTGSAYAAKNSLPIVLMRNVVVPATQNYLLNIAGSTDHVVILGGEAVVPSSLVGKYFKQSLAQGKTEQSTGKLTTPIKLNGTIEQFLTFVEGFLGTPYVSGGATPSPGFDCSGLVQYSYAHFGINLNRVTGDQYIEGQSVASNNLKPGDLVFFSTNAPGASHVGIYVGNRIMINSSNDGVAYDNLDQPYWATKYLGARRVIAQ